MTERTQAAHDGSGISGHPGLEEIAALVDGRLSSADGARLRAHLDSCEECYELFMETLHLQEDLGEEVPLGDGVPIPFEEVPREGLVAFASEERSRARPYWVAAGVAALLVAAVGGGLWRSRNVAPDLSMSALVSPLAGQVPDLARAVWGERPRGPGSPAGENREFKLGVELVNLQVALASNDGKTAQSAAATIYGLLAKNSLIDPAILKFYQELHVKLSSLREASPKDLAPEASAEAEVLRKALQGVDIDLGRWAEAGRFAAMARKAAAVQEEQAQGARYFLATLGKEEPVPGEVKTALEAIKQTSSKGQLSAKDYGDLQGAFEQILDQYYGGGHPIL